MGKTFFFLLPDTFDCERDPFVVSNFITPPPSPIPTPNCGSIYRPLDHRLKPAGVIGRSDSCSARAAAFSGSDADTVVGHRRYRVTTAASRNRECASAITSALPSRPVPRQTSPRRPWLHHYGMGPLICCVRLRPLLRLEICIWFKF